MRVSKLKSILIFSLWKFHYCKDKSEYTRYFCVNETKIRLLDCSSSYPYPPHLLKFAKVNYHIKFWKNWLEVYAIFLFKQLIIFNFEWETKILKRKSEILQKKIIINRGKTDGSTNSDVLINIKDARKDGYRYNSSIRLNIEYLIVSINIYWINN